MAIDDDVIMDSDAQERRFRSFVARPKQPPPAPVEESAPADDEEIPLLTEVVNAEALASAQVDTILDALRKDLENGVSEWLVDVLPAAVANASQQILDELDSKARNTLLPRLQTLIEAQRGTPKPSGDESPSL